MRRLARLFVPVCLAACGPETPSPADDALARDEQQLACPSCVSDPGAVLDDAPVLRGRWEFDGNPLDASAYGNHLVLANGPQYVTGRTGKPATAIKLDGRDDYLTSYSNDESDFDLKTFTLALWVNFSAAPTGGTEQILINKGSHAVGDQYRHNFELSAVGGLCPNIAFRYSGQRLTVGPSGDLVHKYTSVGTSGCFSVGSWHHVAATRSETGLRIYIDGTLRASLSTTDLPNTLNSLPLLLGRCPSAQSAFASPSTTSHKYSWAAMDDVRVYQGVLSASAIAALAVK